MDLFNYKADFKGFAPLAERIRPRNLEEFIGQRHILAEGSLLCRAIREDKISSVILWGPPGTGKTTLARIVAQTTNSHFVAFSAVLSGVKEIREIIKEARNQRQLFQKHTILFVDEIHRFNKAQQDSFLPHIEDGLITLIGATTENPSFEVNPPLLSRCRVLVFNHLEPDDLRKILEGALEKPERGLGNFRVDMDHTALDYLSKSAQGDARIALNALETAVLITKPDSDGVRKINVKIAGEAMQKKSPLYDKGGEEHYNIISALHKSMRGSDPDASCYWLARMLEAGEDPLYIARRMVRFASEDIGNADPRALQITVSAMEAFRFIGLPEGKLALAQAAIYLACAPKSNAVYVAYSAAKEDADKTGSLPVPLPIRNAPTKLMKDLKYGRGYKYAHNFESGFVRQDYLPDKLRGKTYYNPKGYGFEKVIKERLEEWREKSKKD